MSPDPDMDLSYSLKTRKKVSQLKFPTEQHIAEESQESQSQQSESLVQVQKQLNDSKSHK